MEPQKIDAIIELVPGAKCSVNYKGQIRWFSDDLQQPTEEAIQAKLTELKNQFPMKVLRQERNQKLAKTDWRASTDLTLSSEWSTYRQALRDLPSTATPTLDDNGNLQDVTWPKEPT